MIRVMRKIVAVELSELSKVANNYVTVDRATNSRLKSLHNNSISFREGSIHWAIGGEW